MNRRKFLAMLGLAPVVAKAASLMPCVQFWEGTSIPRPLLGSYVSYRFRFGVCYPQNLQVQFRTFHEGNSRA